MFGQGSGGSPAVGDRVLLGPRHLGEGLGRVGGDEDRIEAEAPGPPLPIRDGPPRLAVKHEALTGLQETDGGLKGGPSVRYSIQEGQDTVISQGLEGIRRVHAREAG